MTASETSELVRQVYVDAAMSDEFQLASRRMSDMRVSILTGLTRKEVHRLRNQGDKKKDASNLSRVGRVVAGWNQDPDFTGPYGLPIPLPFEGTTGNDGPDFTELVKRHSGDMSPRAMLDELLRVGLAEIEDEGLIRNTGRTYIPAQLDPASIERLGKVVGRLADTIDFNTRQDDPSLVRFERQAVTDIGLSEEQYKQFSVFLRRKCQELLETLDNWLAMQEGRVDRVRERLPKKKIITGVGIFHFLDYPFPYEQEQQRDKQKER